MEQMILRRQEKYSKILKNKFYMPHELMKLLDIPYSEAKGATEGLEKTDKGYPTKGIVKNLLVDIKKEGEKIETSKKVKKKA